MGAHVRWRKDRGAWFLFVEQEGTRRALRLGPSLADKRRGERESRSVNAAIRRGRLGLEKREAPEPFDAFADSWLERRVNLPRRRGVEDAVSASTARMRATQIRLHLIPHLGARDVRSIDVAAVDDLRSTYLRVGKPNSARSIEIALGTLRLILADAVARRLLAANSVDEWKSAQVQGRSNRRAEARRVAAERVLDSEERESLLAAFETQERHYGTFVLFLAETGCRIGEAITLTWPDLDLRRREARITRHKTKTATAVELSARLVSGLRQLATPIDPAGVRVFRTRGGSPIHYPNFRRRVWNPVADDLFGKARRVTPHTLRHTWATLHLVRGTPIKWVQEQGGWASARMLLDVYSHAIKREMQGHADALSPARSATQRNRAAHGDEDGGAAS